MINITLLEYRNLNLKRIKIEVITPSNFHLRQQKKDGFNSNRNPHKGYEVLPQK